MEAIFFFVVKKLVFDCHGLPLLLTLLILPSELVCVPHPQHQLSKPGELRQEYEAEVSKVSLKIYI